MAGTIIETREPEFEWSNRWGKEGYNRATGALHLQHPEPSTQPVCPYQTRMFTAELTEFADFTEFAELAEFADFTEFAELAEFADFTEFDELAEFADLNRFVARLRLTIPDPQPAIRAL